MKFGDYTKLAKNYRKYRPSYNKKVLEKIFRSFERDKLKVVDIGAGTGIFSKILANIKEINKIYSIEPNFYMRNEGRFFLKHRKVFWKNGSAENINLKKKSIDVITSASSFHWYNKKKCIKQFSKILKKNGYLVLAWNPRITELSPDEKKIEIILKNKYKIKNRISSGRTVNKKLLNKIFYKTPFKLVGNYKSIDKKIIPKKKYIGAWRSVNDIQVQLGKRFSEFLIDVENLLKNKKKISVYYLSKFYIYKF